MKELHSAGISTWASIEPVIDPDLSFEMIREMAGFCDHYKIGILSGKKSYTPQQIRDFAKDVEGGKVSNLLVYILGRDGMYASWGVEGTREKYNADFDLNGNLTSYEKQ